MKEPLKYATFVPGGFMDRVYIYQMFDDLIEENRLNKMMLGVKK